MAKNGEMLPEKSSGKDETNQDTSSKIPLNSTEDLNNITSECNSLNI